MNRLFGRWGAGLLLSCWMTGPVVVAGAADGKPAGANPPLSELMPQGTLLYIGWPGIETLAEVSKETALGKLLAEPEVVRFREAWRKKLWPAIDKRIRDEVDFDANQDEESYEGLRWGQSLTSD